MENKKNLKKRNKKGFTLIELVVVIAILGILAAILIPVIGGFIDRANDATDQANARSLYNCAAMALATGSEFDTADVDTTAEINALSDITDLFGSIPADVDASITVNGSVAASATYNGWTYNSTGTFSGS